MRQEFSYNARRLVSFGLAVLMVVNACACLIWLVVRVQGFPHGGFAGARGSLTLGVWLAQLVPPFRCLPTRSISPFLTQPQLPPACLEQACWLLGVAGAAPA